MLGESLPSSIEINHKNSFHIFTIFTLFDADEGWGLGAWISQEMPIV